MKTLIGGVFKKLFHGRSSSADAEEGYDSVMAAALDPAFYRAGLAEDTLDGRFAMAALHGAVALRRLRESGEDGRRRAEALYRRLFDGFDYGLRETGVGDSSIARKVRKLGEEFFGLARALDGALDANNRAGELETVLKRNGLGGSRPDLLARYLADSDDALAAQDQANLRAGAFAWPKPGV